MKNIIFTPADHVVMQSYSTVVDGLASYLGDTCEIVLYSLEDVEHSIVRIVNGHYTGRNISAPLSKLANAILEHHEKNGGQEYIVYSTTDKYKTPIRFASIIIRGENERTIGMLCINSYMHTPHLEVLKNFFDNPATQSHILDTRPEGVYDPEDAIRETILQVKQRVEQDTSIRPSLKNKEIILQLESQGIFQLKNAVMYAADILGISKNTIYMHLRKANQN